MRLFFAGGSRRRRGRLRSPLSAPRRPAWRAARVHRPGARTVERRKAVGCGLLVQGSPRPSFRLLPGCVRGSQRSARGQGRLEAHRPPGSFLVAVTRPSGVSAIVLAAGGGSRFGGGKLLAELGGRPILETVLHNLHEASVDEIIVVVGADAQRLCEVCKRYGARTVANEEWERGQSTSVLAGLRACGGEAAVVLLGDQPFIGAEAVGRLVAAFAKGAKVAVATYGGKRRNPVLFSREVWPLLEAELAGDEGARSVLLRHPELVVEVPCEGVGAPVDVDTREDLRRLEEMRGPLSGYKMAGEIA